MAQEAEPLEERVVHVIREEALPANNLLAFTVSCDPGDYLITGSCALDNAEAPNHQIELFQHGLDPVSEDSNTWRCGWDNPSDATPQAIATAICLKPPRL